jgi:lipoprotein-releasing system permease protein
LTTPTAADESNALRFRLTGHFKTGLYEYDQTTVFIPLEAAQRLLQLEDRVNSLHVKAEPGTDLDALKARVAKVLPEDAPLIVATWMETEEILINAMRLERIVWITILSALMAVAGFCILAVMSLTVLQKTRDIGILRSLGAGAPGVLGTFIQYGLVVGVIGATLGLAAGDLTLSNIDTVEEVVKGATGWTPWPRTAFYFEKIPVDKDWTMFGMFWLGGIAVSLAASFVPAMRAARTDPIQTLRFEH